MQYVLSICDIALVRREKTWYNRDMDKITVAGSVLTDLVKTIDVFPKQGMLTNITAVRQSVGGCVPNTAIDLKRLAPELRVTAAGRVGNDAFGGYLLERLKEEGVRCAFARDGKLPTGFTDVMTLKSGERTFFHARGANAAFSADDLSDEALDCDLFHLGYLLLLDGLDAADAEYGTAAARLLHSLRSRGIRTAIDTVSAEGGKFRRIVGAALAYTDYAVMNEIEASAVTGVPLRKGEKLLTENLKEACRALFKAGVKRAAVIHCPELGCGMDDRGDFCVVPSLDLPKEYIAGAVGAGDAFCAGTLYSFMKGLPPEDGLSLASLCAACNLSCDDSVGGARSLAETLALENTFARRKL